ncbi:hypothetical protein [Kibdelosporangium phytohabitans]|uniref:Uncharacterized protein n=1 Tax=Kibdelosporangium phytohabitans TaxID=860235 RepID=A0A0N7F2K2_9PSEU|nr:hypothetical protein [Kibdelosporangium phytohabitans]ALG06063.1 hypothetical protein AOZ06_03240 [Kibdelosporangium phytohabitans]MBE1465857.1 hypothetical protein [Kibdelosporangium phytohabitans]
MTDLDATFAEAVRLLTGLVSGEVSPVEAASWATPRYADEAAGYDKHAPLWVALGSLVLADMPAGRGRYLYGPADYQDWLDEALA